MFKRGYNRAVLRIRLETVTPLLIRAGDAGLMPTAADLACVRTFHARYGRTVYIPGSSLKGVLRSAAEASIRGRSFQGGEQGACDPFDSHTSCGTRPDHGRTNGQRGIPAHAVYQQQCLACRLFGSLRLKGRAGIRDLFPWSESTAEEEKLQPSGDNHKRANRVEVRHGVAIDRITGSVKHGPFDQELVPAGVFFFGDISLENYQAWQLGLLAQAIGEVNDGFAQLGSSKSRGLGVARIEVESILHEQTSQAHTRPVGVGLLSSPQDRQDYALLKDHELSACAGEPHGLSQRFQATDRDAARSWLERGLTALGSLT